MRLYTNISQIVMLFLLGACSSSEVETEGNYQIPGSSASIVVERQGFGGGAGSYYKKVFVETKKSKEMVASVRTLYPLKISFSENPSSAKVIVCRGRVFEAKQLSDLSSGFDKPILIKVIINNSCT